MRRCVKPTCSEPADATVVLRYGERTVWLRDLLAERDPNFLELCAPHADRMTAPVGWARVDQRLGASPEGDAAADGPVPVDEAAAAPVVAGAELLPLG